MENKRQSSNERRLAQVRVLKERHFSNDLTLEERLEAKDAQIALLENQVADLQQRLERLEAKATGRPLPESSAPTPRSEAGEPRFNFYRD